MAIIINLPQHLETQLKQKAQAEQRMLEDVIIDTLDKALTLEASQQMTESVVAHFSDLSPSGRKRPSTVIEDMTVHPSSKDQELIAIGWLGENSDFNRRRTPKGFLDELWRFVINSRVGTLGIHPCALCGTEPLTFVTVEHQNQKMHLGSSHTYVVGRDKIFIMPNLIFHYMRDHQYKPPHEFIEAVLDSYDPGSDEYDEQLKALGL